VQELLATSKVSEGIETMNVLLFGCGHTRDRRLMLSAPPSRPTLIPPPSPQWPDETHVDTWDINSECKPHAIVNLNTDWIHWPSPPHVNLYDEVHAYEVLEHLGTQGDAPSFFNTFVGIWHKLKHGGILFATVPHWLSEWAWGDPSHRRVITPGSLVFLSREEYKKQLGKTAMSDFRDLLGDANFDIVDIVRTEHQLLFALQAV
jgi:hypothetical protein